MLKAGQHLSWTWAANESLAYNLHAHIGPSVQYLLQGTTSSANGTYTAFTGGIYSMAWNNPGTSKASLHWKLTSDGQFASAWP